MMRRRMTMIMIIDDEDEDTHTKHDMHAPDPRPAQNASGK
jgi:hypothetical protein